MSMARLVITAVTVEAAQKGGGPRLRGVPVCVQMLVHRYQP